jgi:hypothetical protein
MIAARTVQLILLITLLPRGRSASLASAALLLHRNSGDCGTSGAGRYRGAETSKAVHTSPSTALASGFMETKLLVGFLRFNLDDFDTLV